MMSTKRIFVATTLLFVVSLPAFCATYKCQDAKGNWTEQACPDYQQRRIDKEVGQEQQQPVIVTAPSQTAAPAEKTAKSAVQGIADEVADNDCRRAAKQAYITPSTDAVDRAQNEIAELSKRQWVGDSFHAQQLAQMDAQRIATLRQVVATEQARNDARRAESDRVYADAIRHCDEEKAKREKQ